MFEKRLGQKQELIISTLEKIFGDSFQRDRWQSSLGYGITATVEGRYLEKAGVNISIISGESLPKAATIRRPDLANTPFEACGLSVIIHPANPHVPTAHMNIRSIFCPQKNIRWFAGGYDLTPYIGYLVDSQQWHEYTKAHLDSFDSSLYEPWRNACDEYFYLPHRDEPRGIGGIFFDDYLSSKGNMHTSEFVLSLVDCFINLYSCIALKRLQTSFSQQEQDFMQWRRGRYVEFNLLHDRGTLFGLQSGGRVESILVSLPSKVRWHYCGDRIYSTHMNNLRSHWTDVSKSICRSNKESGHNSLKKKEGVLQ